MGPPGSFHKGNTPLGNNAYTSSTTLKKLRKSPENIFFDYQNGQITDVNLAKSVDFCVHHRFMSSIFGLLVVKKKK